MLKSHQRHGLHWEHLSPQRSLIYSRFPHHPHCITISSFEGCLLEQNTYAWKKSNCGSEDTSLSRLSLKESMTLAAPGIVPSALSSPSGLFELGNFRAPSHQAAGRRTYCPFCSAASACCWQAAGICRMGRVHFIRLGIRLLVSCP